MAQYGLPISDKIIVDWEQGAGDGDGNAFDELNEGFGAGRGSGSGPDGITTYWDNTGVIGFGDRLNTNLSAVTDPEVSTGHLLRNHARKNNSGGRQIDIAIWFEQQTVPTLIGYTEFSNIDDVFTTRVFNLSAAQADSINNYSQLIQRTFGREVGGGGPRRPWESAQEFECPDPPGGGGGFAHSQGVIVG